MTVRVEELMSAGSGEVVHYEQLTIVVGGYCASNRDFMLCLTPSYFFLR